MLDFLICNLKQKVPRILRKVKKNKYNIVFEEEFMDELRTNAKMIMYKTYMSKNASSMNGRGYGTNEFCGFARDDEIAELRTAFEKEVCENNKEQKALKEKVWNYFGERMLPSNSDMYDDEEEKNDVNVEEIKVKHNYVLKVCLPLLNIYQEPCV